MFWVGFVCGALFGCTVAIIAMSLCLVAKSSD